MSVDERVVRGVVRNEDVVCSMAAPKPLLILVLSIGFHLGDRIAYR